jgi:predicted component of type VI protein secretion system
MMDYDSYKYVKNKITKEVNHLKDNLAYSVDNVNQLMYIRGKIQGLETLLQDLTDLQNKQELFDDDTDRQIWKSQNIMRVF